MPHRDDGFAHGESLQGRFLLRHQDPESAREVIEEGEGGVRYVPYLLNRVSKTWEWSPPRICQRGAMLYWGVVLSPTQVNAHGLDTASEVRSKVAPREEAEGVASRIEAVLRGVPDEALVAVMKERGYLVARAGEN